MKSMVNTQYLEELIAKSGKKKMHLANKIGCSRQYLSMKINNKAPFTTDEVSVLCSELNITKLTEKENIFFVSM